MARSKLFLKQAPPQGIPKLRHKEEKKKIMKLCLKKLRTIDDTESLLCKSVLITNTIRKIRQTEDLQPEFIYPLKQDIEEVSEEIEIKEEETSLEYKKVKANEIPTETFIGDNSHSMRWD